jgi:proteasome accessory factor A
MTRNRLSWRDPKISLMDLQYHDIRPDRGIYYKLAGRDMVERITDDETIERAKHEPPQTTRRACAVSSSGRPTSRQGLPGGLGISS